MSACTKCDYCNDDESCSYPNMPKWCTGKCEHYK